MPKSNSFITLEQYQKSIETGELQLSLWHKLSHFGFICFLLFISFVMMSIGVFFYFKDGRNPFVPAMIYVVTGPVLLCIPFYILLKNRLKFKILHSKLGHDQLITELKKLCKEEGWFIAYNKGNTFIAKTKASLTSWGERVTILFNGDEIYVNSISDPSDRPSLIAIGPNRHNLKVVTDLINSDNDLPN